MNRKEESSDFFMIIGALIIAIFFCSPLGYRFVEKEVDKIKINPHPPGYYYHQMLEETIEQQ